MKPQPMTPEQYSAAIAALDLNQISAARFLDISPRTSHYYAHGQPIPRVVQMLLELMIELQIKPDDLNKERLK